MGNIPTALSIAGTDPTGGAGIHADLKTFQESDVYGMAAITSVVAQNTLGVEDVHHLPVPFIEKQINAVINDITPDAVKTGMIATAEMMELIGDMLKNQSVHYVIDPVMIAKSGDPLMEASSRRTMRDVLVPLGSVVTPNIPEAEDLTDMQIQDTEDAKKAAKIIVHELGAKAAVVKGGHLEGEAIDILYDKQDFYHFSSPRFDTKHSHGTGCTFSAVVTAELAKGRTIWEAVEKGKRFISDAINYSLRLGKGNGPTNHWGYRYQDVPGRKAEGIRNGGN